MSVGCQRCTEWVSRDVSAFKRREQEQEVRGEDGKVRGLLKLSMVPTYLGRGSSTLRSQYLPIDGWEWMVPQLRLAVSPECRG